MITSNQKPTFSKIHLDKISSLVSAYSGIEINHLLLKQVIRKITEQMDRYSADNIDEYISILTSPGTSEDSLSDLVSDISVGESYFFRHSDQFEYLYEQFLPEYFNDQSKRHNTMTIWSAGCSRGEEAHSISILANNFLLRNPMSSFSIRAGDICSKNIQHAKKGRYSPNSFRKSFNGWEEILKYIPGKYDNEGFFQLNQRIIDSVYFTKLNLKNANDLAKIDGSDVIMCRNVLIYFDLSFAGKLVEKFYKCLKPGGILLLGETECLPSNNANFKINRYKRTYIYQKVEDM